MDPKLTGSDINYLVQEDLSYELSVRGITETAAVERMRSWLRNLLKLEKSGGSLKPCGVPDRDTERTVITDKLAQLQIDLESWQGNQSEGHKLRAQIRHLFGRVNRLAIGDTPETRKARSDFLSSVLTAKLVFDKKARKVSLPKDSFAVTVAVTSTPETQRSVEGDPHSEDAADTQSESDEDEKPLVTQPQHSRTVTHPQVFLKPKDVKDWNLTFDGEILSVNAFIERAEELCTAHSVDRNNLLTLALFLFTGKALVWYRAHKNAFSSWDILCRELREEFQPPDYDERLWDEIKARRQGQKESVGIYIAFMENLFSRLSRPIDEEVKVSVVRGNLKPTYQIQLGLTRIKSLRKLISLDKELERCQLSADAYNRPPGGSAPTLEPDLACSVTPPKTLHTVDTAEPSTSSSSSSTGLICWKCEKVGHRAKECRSKKGTLCFKCKRPGVTIRTCPNCRTSSASNPALSEN